MRIYVLNGPNLNLIGTREPEIYGTVTLADVEELCHARAKEFGGEVIFRQSAHEGELVDWIHQAGAEASGLVINGAAYSHTSIAIYDALKNLNISIVEVHFSNIYTREEFRHHSYIAKVAQGVVCGMGAQGYAYAIDFLCAQISNRV
ncbi:MAG: type II 3-dehydroquinate dehydratase [Pseudomonadota bacterium]